MGFKGDLNLLFVNLKPKDRMFRFPNKIIAVVTAGAVFATNVALGAPSETNFWELRRENRRESPSSPVTLAALPAPHVALPALPPLKTAIAEDAAIPLSRTPASMASLIDRIPQTHATIKKIHDVPSSLTSPVVVVQDVHLNPEAQANIGAILRSLARDDERLTVGVEGAFGRFRLDRFRAFPDKDIVREIANAFLKNNLIAAPVHAALLSPAPTLQLIGVDDARHYQRNVDAYLAGRAASARTQTEMRRLTSALALAKQRLYSPELRAYDELNRSYHAGSLSLGSYVQGLLRYGSEYAFVLDQFLEAHAMEQTLDLKKAEQERRRALEKLTPRMSEKEMSRLLAASVAYRAGRLSFGAFHADLKNLFEQKRIPLQSYPAFDDYLRYVLLADGIDADRLFSAVADLEKNTVHALTSTPPQRELAAVSELLTLIQKLSDFSLTPIEWDAYRRLAADLRIDQRGSVRIGGESVPLPRALNYFEDFYREADARSATIADRVTSLDEGKNGIVSLVIGGFHTPGLTVLLEDRKIPYVVVSPKITKLDDADGAAYLSIFAREKEPLDRLFTGNKLFVSPSAVAAVGTGLPAARATENKLLAEEAARHFARHGETSDPLLRAERVSPEAVRVTSEADGIDAVVDVANPPAGIYRAPADGFWGWFRPPLTALFDRLPTVRSMQRRPAWRPVYWLITVVGSPLLETFIFHQKIWERAIPWMSPDIFGVSAAFSAAVLVAISFAALHLMIERLADGRHPGQPGNAAFRFLLSMGYSVPFLLFGPGQVAFGLALALHASYNAAILSGKLPTWSRRLPLASAVNPILEKGEKRLIDLLGGITNIRDRDYWNNVITDTVGHQFHESERPVIEAVTNALDAGADRVEVSVVPAWKIPFWEMDKDDPERNHYRMTIKDNGRGMSVYELINFLLIPKISGQEGKGESIGLFGVGFYSLLRYLVTPAHRLTVETTKDGGRHRVTFRRINGEFTVKVERVAISPEERTASGTVVTVDGEPPAGYQVKHALRHKLGYQTRGQIYFKESSNEFALINDMTGWEDLLPVADGKPRLRMLAQKTTKEKSGLDAEALVTVQGVTALSVPLFGQSKTHGIALELPYKEIVPRARNKIEVTARVRQAVRDVIDEVCRIPDAHRRQYAVNSLLRIVEHLQSDNEANDDNLLDYLINRWLETLPPDFPLAPDIDSLATVENRVLVPSRLYEALALSGRTQPWIEPIEIEGHLFHVVDIPDTDEEPVGLICESVFGTKIFFLNRKRMPRDGVQRAALLANRKLLNETTYGNSLEKSRRHSHPWLISNIQKVVNADLSQFPIMISPELLTKPPEEESVESFWRKAGRRVAEFFANIPREKPSDRRTVTFQLSWLPQIMNSGIEGFTWADVEWESIVEALRLVPEGEVMINPRGIRHMQGAIRASIESQNVASLALVRENAQNTYDAVLEQKDSLEGRPGTLEIRSKEVVDSEGNPALALEFQDSIGMDPTRAMRDLLIPGVSSKRGAVDFIGRFGQGFFTNLKNAERVDVVTSKGNGIVTRLSLVPVRNETGVLIDVKVTFDVSREDRTPGTTTRVLRRSKNVEEDRAEAKRITEEYLGIVDPSVLKITFDEAFINRNGATEERRIASLPTPYGPISVYRVDTPHSVITHRKLFMRQLLWYDDFFSEMKRDGGIALPHDIESALLDHHFVLDLPENLDLVSDRSDLVNRAERIRELNPAIYGVIMLALARLIAEGGDTKHLLPYDMMTEEYSVPSDIVSDGKKIADGNLDEVDWARYGRLPLSPAPEEGNLLDGETMLPSGQNPIHLLASIPIWEGLSILGIGQILRLLKNPGHRDEFLKRLPPGIRSFAEKAVAIDTSAAELQQAVMEAGKIRMHQGRDARAGATVSEAYLYTAFAEFFARVTTELLRRSPHFQELRTSLKINGEGLSIHYFAEPRGSDAEAVLGTPVIRINLLSEEIQKSLVAFGNLLSKHLGTESGEGQQLLSDLFFTITHEMVHLQEKSDQFSHNRDFFRVQKSLLDLIQTESVRREINAALAKLSQEYPSDVTMLSVEGFVDLLHDSIDEPGPLGSALDPLLRRLNRWRWGHAVYLVLTAFLMPVLETGLYQYSGFFYAASKLAHAGWSYTPSVVVAMATVAVVFSFSHIIVSWLAGDKQDGWVRDAGLRAGLSILFNAPFIVLDPFSAFLIASFLHAAYNAFMLWPNRPRWIPAWPLASLLGGDRQHPRDALMRHLRTLYDRYRHGQDAIGYSIALKLLFAAGEQSNPDVWNSLGATALQLNFIFEGQNRIDPTNIRPELIEAFLESNDDVFNRIPVGQRKHAMPVLTAMRAAIGMNRVEAVTAISAEMERLPAARRTMDLIVRATSGQSEDVVAARLLALVWILGHEATPLDNFLSSDFPIDFKTALNTHSGWDGVITEEPESPLFHRLMSFSSEGLISDDVFHRFVQRWHDYRKNVPYRSDPSFQYVAELLDIVVRRTQPAEVEAGGLMRWLRRPIIRWLSGRQSHFSATTYDRWLAPFLEYGLALAAGTAIAALFTVSGGIPENAFSLPRLVMAASWLMYFLGHLLDFAFGNSSLRSPPALLNLRDAGWITAAGIALGLWPGSPWFGFGLSSLGATLLHLRLNRKTPPLSASLEKIVMGAKNNRREALANAIRLVNDGPMALAKVGEKTSAQNSFQFETPESTAADLAARLKEMIHQGILSRGDVEGIIPLLTSLIAAAFTPEEVDLFIGSLSDLLASAEDGTPIDNVLYVDAQPAKAMRQMRSVLRPLVQPDGRLRSGSRVVVVTPGPAREFQNQLKGDLSPEIMKGVQVINGSPDRSIWDLIQKINQLDPPGSLQTARLRRLFVPPDYPLPQGYFDLPATGLTTEQMKQITSHLRVYLLLDTIFRAVEIDKSQLPSWDKLKLILSQA